MGGADAGGVPEAGSAARLAAPQGIPASGIEPSVAEQPNGTQKNPLGLDVSGWQQNVDWNSVRNRGARFAYIKSSEGPWALNDYFGQQYKGAANAGLIRGSYHFARPNLSSGASQAQVMLSSGGGWSADGKTMPPALDIEDNPYDDGTGKCYGLSPAQMASWVNDFVTTISRNTNKAAVIYTGYYFWQDCLGGTTRFAQTNPLWIAAYYASSPWMPGGWPQHTIWQYADGYADAGQTRTATFPGDQNVFNGTMDQLRKLAGAPNNTSVGPVGAVGLIPGATLISGKWAGDGKSYIGWYKDSFWCLQMPAAERKCFYFGSPGDKPVVGDWDGDGTDSIGIVRNGSWQLTNSVNSLTVDIVQNYGVGSDSPIVGDWNGDGKTTIGIFRSGSWQLTNSQSGGPGVDVVSNYGIPSDTPLIGDWNGDGKDTFGVWRSGIFWLSDNAQSPVVKYVFPYGVPTDRPTVGDWDGNGKSTVGIVRGNGWQMTNNLGTLTVDSVRQ
ncbi:GH25 family lysozyme [Paenarthrobacter sp. PH39-S1]|uniref:GH25 family lysozyme n=1 Tax=Paenarthrobacter sp. PH39-S1 TaxID=3046204 RepID=UPI0024BAC2E6|nr:GH25 family lysozyme [Paenarthrobacter sp. PH39-S1]MDJ0356419.1 GH25 family lysozyme [Paenarthrobacter sp. PH39-S1]